MKRSLLVLSICLGLVIGFSSLAYSQNTKLVTAQDLDTILNIAKGFGKAELTTDRDGDPKISGKISGSNYSVYFFGCKDGKDCRDIQFVTGWSGYDVTIDQINDWNNKKRYGKVYLDDENDPMLIMPVNLYGGVSYENLEDTFDWWVLVLEEFQEQVLGRK